MATKKGGKGKDVPTSGDITLIDETASQFVAPSNPESSFSILTEEEAERKGDFTALLRIRLANAAREINEHMDVNGDGVVAGSLSPGEGHDSVLFARDEYGGCYAKDGYYHDKFGGYYDGIGYTAKDGSYTSIGGEHWDAKTGKVTNADGTERRQTSDVVAEAAKKDPKIGRDQVKADTQIAESREEAERKRKKAPSQKRGVDTKGASQSAGGGLRSGVTITADDQEKSDIILQRRIERHEDTSKPITAADIKYAAEQQARRKRGVEHRRGALSEFIAAQSTAPVTSAELKQANEAFSQRGDNYRKTTFKAVSKEEAQAALGRIHVPVKEGAHVHSSADHGGAADHDHDDHSSTAAAKAVSETKPKDQKDNAATTPGGNWYADSKGGYWDEYGGYYDKDGGYWEVDGGYWDKYNVYTDVNGGRTWPDKSYLDPNFNYVDKDGCYWTDDGTKIKPPAGMDFKKQMQEAAAKHEQWHLPEELKSLITSKVPAPDLNLKSTAPITPDIASSLTPIKLTDPKAGDAPKAEPVTPVLSPIKIDAAPLRLEPVKFSPSLDLPPLKLNTNVGASTTTSGTSFSLLDAKQNSTPASTDNNFNVDQSHFQMCTAQSSPKNDFSSFFNNYHDFLSSAKPETKFYDLSNITWSPSIDAKTQLAVLTTPADNKTAVPPPKLA
ncbi:MAG: hypothetical protein EPN97_00920 [Alphaproteobacteria bacterium]|nr:MAG: hypothetical protein EPN97_00920 [Alphaproteobacteria bacterium]